MIFNAVPHRILLFLFQRSKCLFIINHLRNRIYPMNLSCAKMIRLNAVVIYNINVLDRPIVTYHFNYLLQIKSDVRLNRFTDI